MARGALKGFLAHMHRDLEVTAFGPREVISQGNKAAAFGWFRLHSLSTVLVMHGDDDQIVPYADSAPLSAKLLKNCTLKTYKGFPHGMPTTEADTINADLLAFLKG